MVGQVDNQRLATASIFDPDSNAVSPVGYKKDTANRIGQEGHWEQLGTTCILINALNGSTVPVYSSPMRFDMVRNKLSVKADLHGHLGVSR